jgi:hypothetical protein
MVRRCAWPLPAVCILRLREVRSWTSAAYLCASPASAFLRSHTPGSPDSWQRAHLLVGALPWACRRSTQGCLARSFAESSRQSGPDRRCPGQQLPSLPFWYKIDAKWQEVKP